MKIWSDSFKEGARIPGEFAFAVPASPGHVRLSDNRNPHLAWDEAPAGTRGFALIIHDADVPSRGDDVNKEGREVPADLPRVDFFHLSLVDILPEICEIAVGALSSGVTPHGKPGPDGPLGLRTGINDYTGWFAGDKDMAGDYYGYDGPCPPWNDAREHRYYFTLYALDCEQAPVSGRFTGAQLREAIAPHVLAKAVLSGRYTLNPALG